MESSPLVKAHDHAREASAATHTADTATAVTEHALAAGEFATAAGDTTSVEALRTLRLLEQHHQRLSQILRVSLERKQAEASKQNEADAEEKKEKELSEKGIENDKPAPLGTATTTTSVSGVVTRGEFTGGSDAAVAAAAVVPAGDSPVKALRGAAGVLVPAGAAGQPVAGATPSQQPTQKQPHRRYPPSRELSSSIANNLASARGIRGNGSPGPAANTSTSSRHGHNQRGQPAAPSVSNDLAPGSLGGSPGRGSRAQMQNVLQQTQTQTQSKPSWVPPALQQSQQSQQPQPQMFMGTDADDADSDPVEAKADDGFSRFYNRFGSIINRLSAPLAFAGLPLVAEEPAPKEVATAMPQNQHQYQHQERPVRGHQKQNQNLKQQESQRAPSRSRATSQLSTIAASAYSYYNSYGGSGHAEPDLSQIYSHAALRAIGASGGSNPNDSFYVVPKTGHTASYANILSFDQKEKRRMAASIHGGDDLVDVRNPDIIQEDDQDDFVDARERPTQVQMSPRASGSGHGSRMHNARSSSAPDHVLEELYTENQGLKDMLDKLSRRLHAFEASAQSSHMALQESMRFMRPGSPSNDGKGISSSTSSLTPAAAAAAVASASAAASLKANRGAGSLSNDGAGSDSAGTKHLEEELARVMARLEASERERAHQEKTLQKYREKWEKLKAGAKARREAQGPA